MNKAIWTIRSVHAWGWCSLSRDWIQTQKMVCQLEKTWSACWIMTFKLKCISMIVRLPGASSAWSSWQMRWTIECCTRPARCVDATFSNHSFNVYDRECLKMIAVVGLNKLFRTKTTVLTFQYIQFCSLNLRLFSDNLRFFIATNDCFWWIFDRKWALAECDQWVSKTLNSKSSNMFQSHSQHCWACPVCNA